MLCLVLFWASKDAKLNIPIPTLGKRIALECIYQSHLRPGILGKSSEPLRSCLWQALPLFTAVLEAAPHLQQKQFTICSYVTSSFS